MNIRTLFFLLVLLCFTPFARAQTPNFISFQGMLRTQAGMPLNSGAPVALHFAIYDLVANDTVYSEDDLVTVNLGMFHVQLGRGTNKSRAASIKAIAWSRPYWLIITQGNAAPYQPIELASVGYAYFADVADSARVAGGGGISGTGKNPMIPIWTGPSSLGNSNLMDNGTTLSYSAPNVSAGSAYQIQGNTVLRDSGPSNIFVGVGAGAHNTTGNQNTFTGWDAGFSTMMSDFNTFSGVQAGYSTTTGNSNTFSGGNAGYSNLNGGQNTFLGVSTGFYNTSGNNNTFVGSNAGDSNKTGSGNTIIGSGAEVGSGALTNATAIGSKAVVSESNALVLGSVGTNVGIGTSTPSAPLSIGQTSRFAPTTDVLAYVSRADTAAPIGGEAVGAFFLAGANQVGGGDVGLMFASGTPNYDAAIFQDDSDQSLKFAMGGPRDDIPKHHFREQDTKMTITQAGNIGLGTMAPQSELEVDGDGTITLAARNSDPATPKAGTWMLYIFDDGTTRALRVKGPGGTINTVSTVAPFKP